MSALTFNPLPLLEKVGWFGGLRAALMVPRGVEDAVMPAVVGAIAGPEERERGESRGGSREDIAGETGLGGAEGVGSGVASVDVDSGDSTIVTGTWSGSGEFEAMVSGRRKKMLGECEVARASVVPSTSGSNAVDEARRGRRNEAAGVAGGTTTTTTVLGGTTTVEPSNLTDSVGSFAPVGEVGYGRFLGGEGAVGSVASRDGFWWRESGRE